MTASDVTTPAVPDVALPSLVVGSLRGRRAEVRTTLTFLAVNGTIAVGGYLLLHLLIREGLSPGAANAVQAVVTLQVNFVAGLLLTWRWQTSGLRHRVWQRWLYFHTGRGAVLLVNLAVFPVAAARAGVTPAFVALLVLGAAVHYALDRWWVFRRLAGAGAAS